MITMTTDRRHISRDAKAATSPQKSRAREEDLDMREGRRALTHEEVKAMALIAAKTYPLLPDNDRHKPLKSGMPEYVRDIHSYGGDGAKANLAKEALPEPTGADVDVAEEMLSWWRAIDKDDYELIFQYAISNSFDYVARHRRHPTKNRYVSREYWRRKFENAIELLTITANEERKK